jgi:hypothetical protein
MGQLTATNRTLKRLAAEGLVEGREALAELARSLSRTLDDDDPNATLAGIAAVSKELRATLAELGKARDVSVGDEAQRFLDGLSSPVGDDPD